MITEKQAITILRRHAASKKDFLIVYRHSQAVKKIALKIAKGTKADASLIATGSLLHDIGRFRHPPWHEGIRHGVHGASILKKEGLLRHARIAARHVGSGISKAEAKKLKLPPKNFLPRTIEEKIICYADSLVFFDKVKNYKAVKERYREEVGIVLVKRTLKLRTAIRKVSPYMRKHPGL